MKRGLKVFWIVCASIFLLGISFVVTGAALGADLGNVTQRIGWFQGQNFTGMIPRTDQQMLDSTLLEGTQNLSIDIDALMVRIETTSGSNVEIDKNGLSSELQDALQVTETAEELQISLRQNTRRRVIGLFGTRNRNEELVIRIPQNHTFAKATIQLGAGHMIIDQLLADQVDLMVGAGRLEVQYLEATDLMLDVGAGEAVISNVYAVNARIEGGVGRISVRGEVSNHLYMNNGIGETTFIALGVETDYNYNISTGIGEVIIGTRRYSGLGNSTIVDHNASRSMEIRNGIGKVSVLFD